MLNINVNPQPITITLDMANIEKYDEKLNQIRAFVVATKTVKEDVDGVDFTTEKTYDRKVLINFYKIEASFMANAFKEVIAGTADSVTVIGEVVSSTEATLIMDANTYNINGGEGEEGEEGIS